MGVACPVIDMKFIVDVRTITARACESTTHSETCVHRRDRCK